LQREENMRRKTLLIVGFALFATGAMCAADVPQMRSALITDITVSANDSPLVRAAKMVALSRAQMTVHSTRVIDNDALRTMGASHFSVATTEPAAIPATIQVTPAAPVSPYRQQPNQTYVPANTAPVVPVSPFQLTPPPPTSSPTPYRPQP
jgi:hypothetical protein